jgi:hypothetical protein
MATDYSGVIGLAQTVLALNMAYIALDRFRYRSQIENKFREAQSRTADMPRDYMDDLAWRNVESIAAGNSAKGWTAGQSGYWCYSGIFGRARDRKACYFFAAFAILVLLAQAYDSIFLSRAATDGMPGWRSVVEVPFDWTILIVLTLGVAAPPVFVLAGRYAVTCAEKSIEDNMSHLARRYREAAGDDVSTSLERFELEERQAADPRGRGM